MVLTEAIIQDESDSIKVIWFNQPFLTRNLKKDERISLSGKLSFGAKGHYISNPNYEVMRSASYHALDKRLVHTAEIGRASCRERV